MKRVGACPCRAVRYAVAGPVREVLVCHETVSFAVETLADPSGLEVAAHIWIGGVDGASRAAAGPPSYRGGLPATAVVLWRA